MKGLDVRCANWPRAIATFDPNQQRGMVTGRDRNNHIELSLFACELVDQKSWRINLYAGALVCLRFD